MRSANGIGELSRGAALIGAALLCASLAGSTVHADPTPIVTDPFPEMKNPQRCHGPDCGRRDRPAGSVILDCSGRKPGAAHSLSEAIRRAPVNGEILIMSAPQGRTCAADGATIVKPVTIRPYDAIGSAYIEGTVPPPISDRPIGRFTSVDGNAANLMFMQRTAPPLARASEPLTRGFGLTVEVPADPKAVKKAEDLVAEKEKALRGTGNCALPANKDAAECQVQAARAKLDALPEDHPDRDFYERELEDRMYARDVALDEYLQALAALKLAQDNKGKTFRRKCSIETDIARLGAAGKHLAGKTSRPDQTAASVAAIAEEAKKLSGDSKTLVTRLGAPDAQETVCKAYDAAAAGRAKAALEAFDATATTTETVARKINKPPAGAEQVPNTADASCLEVQLPAGDTLNIVGVNFVVRSGDHPCINVVAGTVMMRHVKIDSRGTRWAFDVKESGRLVLEDTKIETDGGGIYGRRAVVDLRRVEIQLERGRRGIGASLTGADGSISDLSVVGGEVGLMVSSGSRGLLIERPVISDSGVGIHAVGNAGQGTVSVRGANIQRAIVGAWIRDNARVELLGGSITQSESVGIFVNDSGALIRGLSHIDGATHGVAVSNVVQNPVTSAATPPLSNLCTRRAKEDGFGIVCGDLKEQLATLGGNATNDVAMDGASPLGQIEIDRNTIRSSGGAVIRLKFHKERTQRVLVTDNILDCPRGASCISGEGHWARNIEKRGNRCTKNNWFSSCND